MDRADCVVCLSISTLEKELGDTLEYTRIEYSSDGDEEYFDLYNDNDELCCLDGEEVLIIKDDGDTLTFRNENDKNNVEFKLTLTEFLTASFN